MMRVCLSVSMLAVCLMGFPWLGTPAYGQTDAGHYGCPCMEEMQAYGECYWYYDNYRHGALAEATAKDECRSEEVAAQEGAADARCEAGGSDTVPSPSLATGSDDCWYDAATAEFHRHEFSSAAEHVAADEAMADALADEVVDQVVAETSKDEASAWQYREYADDYYADYYDLWDAPQVQEVCRKPETAATAMVNDAATEEAETEEAMAEEVVAEDAATENAWRGEYEYEYEYDYEYGYEYGYSTTAAESSCAADRTEVTACEPAGQDAWVEEAVAAEAPAMDDEAWKEDWDWDSEYAEYADRLNAMYDSNHLDQPTTSTETSTDADVPTACEEAMESPCSETETVMPSTQSPADWSSNDYDYDYEYGGYMYGYESYQDYESRPAEPVQVQEDADIGMIEEEDADEEIPAGSDSEMVRLDGEVILSLARTLDRIGSTLQSFSSYLTEMATAELAERHDGAMLR